MEGSEVVMGVGSFRHRITPLKDGKFIISWVYRRRAWGSDYHNEVNCSDTVDEAKARKFAKKHFLNYFEHLDLAKDFFPDKTTVK